MKRREQRATWFKCFLSSKATIDAVPDENVGKGLKAAFAYFEHKTIPELDRSQMSFSVLCAHISTRHSATTRRAWNQGAEGQITAGTVKTDSPPIPSL